MKKEKCTNAYSFIVSERDIQIVRERERENEGDTEREGER